MKKILLFITLIVNCTGASAQIITTIAGNGTYGTFGSGDGGLATAATLNGPDGIALFGKNLYIGEVGTNCVRKIDLSTGIITTFAGTGIEGYFGDNGLAVNAQLSNVYGLAVDTVGNVYIADEGNSVIRKVDTSGMITTFAGDGTYGYGGDNGPATAAMMSDINGVIPDRHGNVYIADLTNNCIRKVDTAGIITTIAGNSLVYGYGGDGGPATAAVFKNIPFINMDTIGNIYIGDFYNNRLRKIDTSGIVITIAGKGIMGYSGDTGPADSAECFGPNQAWPDRFGNIFFSDTYNNVIREINTSGIIYTIAGTGTAGYTGDNGIANAAMLNVTGPIVGDGCGRLYICDYGNNCVRLITYPPSIINGVDTVCIDHTITLSDSIGCGVWHSSNTAKATVDTLTGRITGVANGTTTISYTANDSTVTKTIFVEVCESEVKNTANTLFALTIFPNPNNGSFNVDITSIQKEDAAIVISNMLGQKVKELTTTTNTDTQVQLNAPPGLYFISAITSQGTQSAKAIVQ